MTAIEPIAGRVGSVDLARTMLTRLLEVSTFLCIPTVVSLLAVAPATRHTISVLTGYKPLFLPTRPQTLIGSAFYLPNIKMVGLTTVFTVALFLPYVLARGMGWALRVFLSGHVIATLAVAIVVVPGDWFGWRQAVHIVHSSDLGASAGLAACAGGLAILLGRRWALLGGLLLAGLTAFFLRDLAHTHGLNRMADIEHLIAVSVGVGLEAWWLPHNGGRLWPRRLDNLWLRQPGHAGRGGGPAERS
jgi:hypothetical protein